MSIKRHAAFVVAALCVAGLPFAGASANTSAFAPLMPTRDITAHHVLMQNYVALGRVSPAGVGAVILTPLMPTKDPVAHRDGTMQAFSWFRPYEGNLSVGRSDGGVAAPLMPTKDPRVHQG